MLWMGDQGLALDLAPGSEGSVNELRPLHGLGGAVSSEPFDDIKLTVERIKEDSLATFPASTTSSGLRTQ